MKSPKAPKEDPEEKAARERERRLAEEEKARAAGTQAEDLTTDITAVYGVAGRRAPNRGNPRGRRTPSIYEYIRAP